MQKTSLKWKIAQKAELKWWQRYLKNKSPETYLHWKKNYWQQLLSELTSHLCFQEGQNILDAGCGPAGIFTVLDDFANYHINAIDPLLDKYEQELPHFSKTMYPHIQFNTQSLETLDEKEQYDIVFCLNAINHVSDLTLSMDNLLQSLKTGGQLVLSIDAHRHSFFKHLFRLLPGDILHPHQYDLKEYQAMVTQRNCQIQYCFLKKKELFFNYFVLIGTKAPL